MKEELDNIILGESENLEEEQLGLEDLQHLKDESFSTSTFDPLLLESLQQLHSSCELTPHTLEEREVRDQTVQDIWEIAKEILSLRQLQCFYLRYYSSKSEDAVAAILGISQPMVNVTILNAIRKLRKFWKDYLPEEVRNFLTNKNINHSAYFRYNLAYIDRYGHCNVTSKIREVINAYGPRFRNCIAIPIYNLFGSIESITFRNLDKNKLKYDITPGTDKSSLVYGLNWNWKKILRKDSVIIVEGPFDMIKLYQKGHRNTIALMGCDLSRIQLSLLLRFTKNFILMLDGDKAGYTKMKKTYDKYKKYADISFCYLPEGMDPDEYVDKYKRLSIVSHEDLLKKKILGGKNGS